MSNVRLPTAHLGRVVLLSLGAISTSGSTAVQRQATVPSEYVLTVRAANPTVTEVEASLAVTDDILEMDEGYAEHLPDRWAKFVHGLSASDTAGRTIALQYLGAAKWRIPAPRPRVIRLAYRVALDHDKRV